MKQLPILKPGDSVELIAPAFRCTPERIESLKNLFASWQLHCIVPDDIMGTDLLCANSDEIRFQHLKNALLRSETKAIICARGGYGSMRLIPDLLKVSPPSLPKLFLGMSDTTALQLYLQQAWKWPTVHGSVVTDKYSPESIAAVKAILFGEVSQVEFTKLEPLNDLARKEQVINSSLIGGNLCLVQSGVGTKWQIDGADKIIFLEEISERGYRVDRMLEHLQQANIFKDAAAIVFGDFFECEEPNGDSLISPVLQRFAERCSFPVARVKGIGHAFINFPIPLGTAAKLHLGEEIKLISAR